MATDVPRVDQVHMESPTPLNPFGVHITQCPVTPPYILELLANVE